MSANEVARLHALVYSDSAVRDRLLSATDRATFVAETVAVAEEHGILVDATAIEEALVAARRKWLERWI
jgi:hypothetical protein